MKKIMKQSMSMKMFAAMVLGILAGIVFGNRIVILKPLGTIYINLLKMTMIPIVMTSIIVSVANLDSMRKFGRMALRVLITFASTTTIAAMLSMLFVNLIKPGVGFTELTEKTITKTIPSLSDIFMGIVPTNIIQAMMNGDFLAIIFFCILLGIALSLIGEKKKPVMNVLDSLQSAIMMMIRICMKYTPIGIFFLMACVSGEYGMKIFSVLGKFILTDYIIFLIQMLVIYGSMLAMCQISLFTFLCHVKSVLLVAASTTSSAVTVPVELEIAESHLGVPKGISGLIFPVGATMNQNGTAINIMCCVFFTAQVYGVSFTVPQMCSLVLMVVVSAMGCSGIPSGGTVFTLMILGKFGLPTEAYGMIIACYILVDIGSTTINIMGDMVNAIVISSRENVLMREVWKKGRKHDK